MPSFNFSYARLPIPPSEHHPQGHMAMRPWLAARISVPHDAPFVDCVVCLDTGADHCVFPLSIASRIGLDLKNMPKGETEARTSPPGPRGPYRPRQGQRCDAGA